MANYEFEVIMATSVLIDVEADSKEEALELATREATAEWQVVGNGFAYPWDNVDVQLINSDAEDW